MRATAKLVILICAVATWCGGVLFGLGLRSKLPEAVLSRLAVVSGMPSLALGLLALVVLLATALLQGRGKATASKAQSNDGKARTRRRAISPELILLLLSALLIVALAAWIVISHRH